jgi:phosphate transport system protein
MEPTSRIVPHFRDELDALKERLLVMGGLVEAQVHTAIRSLIERDHALIGRVTDGDASINQLHIDIDSRCFTLLALHQPMATDLRTIVSAVKINTDLERVGDLAVNIVEAADRYLRYAPVKLLVDIPRMAELAQAMLRDALDAFVRCDIVLAQHVLDTDDKVDDLKGQVFRELLVSMGKNHVIIEPALDVILVSRHLERIADHATNIAEDVVFIVSARDVRHHAWESDQGA